MSELKYNNNYSFVSFNDVAFESTEKPNLPFLYDSLNYSSTNDDSFFIINGTRKKLTKSQRERCEKYCEDFFNNKDYYVFAYNENKIFTRKMYKSEAENYGLKYIINVIPKYPVSRWNESQNTWEKIVTIIKNDGTVVRNPTTYCDQCVVFLNQEETNNLPDIDKYQDNYHKYDIESKTWITIGDELSDRKTYLIFRLRQLYDIKRWKTVFGHHVPSYEMYGWEIERQEAIEYTSNKNSKTPYIDGIIEGLNNTSITKDIYVKKILENITEEKSYQLGKLHGKMMQYVYKINEANSLDELDKIESEINSDK